MNSFIYLRGLKHADHTVFCVEDGQKFYYDPQFGTRMAYSSGQQVKRSILEAVLNDLNEPMAPTTFNYEIKKEKNGGEALSNKEPWSPCDPTYTDQLLGGWMKAESKGIPLKRRSPFSISAMRPLHPLLGGLEGQKENLTFDRSSNPDHNPVIVRDAKGNILSTEEIDDFLERNGRALSRRNWIPDNTRASGLYIYDIAIDMRTLFAVSTNTHEPELAKETIQKLNEAGWIPSENAFGKCLVLPAEKRQGIIPAIAKGILNWRITSNQARTFSLMETLAVAISDNANKIAYAIRATLDEESERPKAIPIIDRNAGSSLYVTPTCGAYVKGAEGSPEALDLAEQKLIEMLSEFDYDNQLYNR